MCVLWLYFTRFGDTALIWGNMYLSLPLSLSPSASLSHTHSLSPDEDSVCPQLLCHMSQLRQKCLLGFFSQYFSPVTRFAPGRCTNPINRKPMAPPGQIKTAPLLSSPHLSSSLLFCPQYTHTHTHSPSHCALCCPCWPLWSLQR